MWATLLLVASVLLAAAVALHLTPIRSYLADARQLRENLLALGVWVYPLTIALVALLLGLRRAATADSRGRRNDLRLLDRPCAHSRRRDARALLRLPLHPLGRTRLGLNRWPKARKWADMMQDQGVVGVLLVRQLPAHAMLINMCLALSNVKHGHFLIGTALGLLPKRSLRR